MNLKLLAAATMLSTAIAAPALAQDPAPRAHAVRMQQDQARIYHRENGFWPADVAAGVVNGAIGTAGAIASAPFHSQSYAYNDGYYGRGYHGSYMNGFVCEPGTMFRGEDGRRHICQ